MPTAILAFKRLAWYALLDIPVGLTPSQAAAGEPAGHILFGETILYYDGLYGPDIGGGWLVMLAIANKGWPPVRGTDFAAPLTFTFPGRQILSAQISPRPDVRSATRGPASPSSA